MTPMTKLEQFLCILIAAFLTFMIFATIAPVLP